MPPNRKITCLRHFDYRLNNAYFVTICTHRRLCAFGRIENATMRQHPFGQIAEQCWVFVP